MSRPHKVSERRNRREPSAKGVRAAKDRIIRRIITGDREWVLHATKGWRSYRI